MKKIFHILIILLMSCSSISIAFADAYGYVNQDGVIVLSDTPLNEKFELVATAPLERVAIQESKQRPRVTPPQVSAVMEAMNFHQEILVASESSGVETALLHAVITAESNYNPKAVSVKGATGLMQLMPQTARRFGVRNMYDPKQNIQGGARYLAYLLELFNNNHRLAIAAYNAGENAVIRYGNKVPPYKETLHYVDKVMTVYKNLRSG